MTFTNTIREEHNKKSDLLSYVLKEIKEEEFRKLDRELILDFRLKANDIVVYLIILFEGNYNGYYRPIPLSFISGLSGIKKEVIYRHTEKLERLGYIHIKRQSYNSQNQYKIKPNPKSFLPLTYYNTRGMSVNKKSYVRKLRALYMSYGRNYIPCYSKIKDKVKGNLTRTEYTKIKKLYEDTIKKYVEEKIDIYEFEHRDSDIIIYNSL